jgi:hypothetical protein
MPFVTGGGDNPKNPLSQFLTSLAQKLIWASLYFLVFEMRKVQDRLKSESQ